MLMNVAKSCLERERPNIGGVRSLITSSKTTLVRQAFNAYVHSYVITIMCKCFIKDTSGERLVIICSSRF